MPNLLILLAILLAQTAPTFPPKTSVAPTATTVSTAPVSMDKQTLAPFYQRELGDKYDPSKLDELYQAHQLLEHYFSDPPNRKSIVEKLDASGIDPNVLGRIVRIRMN